jgi:putative ABC transport system substrate-binding protein
MHLSIPTMNFYTKLCIIIFSIISLSSCEQHASSKDSVTIGIIEPLEHTAMNQIVAGYTETLKKLYNKPVTIKVENAQNDANLERAIIQKMRDENYTLIVPIGVGATQMTLAMAHTQPVVSLASDLSDADRNKLNPCHVAVVHDEISAEQLLAFIHVIYPDITAITLIHSAADKVFPEVKDAIAAGKKYGISVKPKMVATLPELYSTAQSLPADTQGIFVLKDSLIVSGISTLQKIAAQKHIPLITSDEGSVQDGAGMALGVHEREIGVEGAKLSAAILNGKTACELPIVGMANLTVFINKKSLNDEAQSLPPVMDAAAKFNYNTDLVNGGLPA